MSAKPFSDQGSSPTAKQPATAEESTLSTAHTHAGGRDRGTLRYTGRGHEGRQDMGPMGHNMKLTAFSMRAMGWTGHWKQGDGRSLFQSEQGLLLGPKALILYN